MPGNQPTADGPVAAEGSGRSAQVHRLVELLHLSARGRETAFAELYDLTSARIHGVVLRVVRSPEQAAEVAQEVYLDIWLHAAHYSPTRGNPLAWMTTIAHRRAVDRVRSLVSTQAREERYGHSSVERDTDHVWENVKQDFETHRVRKALQALTAAQREAIDLAYFGGYTQREVAGLLRVPIGTVKTRIRDGLIKLRDGLGIDDE
ncbi:MAG TPA: ECF RNA polymerase sigma factor SigK [Propionibacteriaceae bacterium]|jgi:RNA polymerase sigma-70 factor (ECF subfamily)|nr:ECF RNA polymerase sigma factor SigK [Propionibacteriaceae bacterium]